MQNPYQAHDTHLYQEPERTSVMAVLSLVFGILGCCTVVTAPVGLILGIFSVIGINKSKGRVGGMGFAIAGIVISILSLLLTVFIFIGFRGAASVFFSEFGGKVEAVFTDVRSGDYDAVRSAMGSPGADTSDEDLAAFHAAYSQDLGEFVGMPDGIGELFSSYGVVINQFEPYNGRQGYIPMPARFDSGWVLVIYVMNPAGGNGNAPALEKLILIGSDGTEYTIPPDAGDEESANRPLDSASTDSDTDDSPTDADQDEAQRGENADEPGTEDPEGP